MQPPQLMTQATMGVEAAVGMKMNQARLACKQEMMKQALLMYANYHEIFPSDSAVTEAAQMKSNSFLQSTEADSIEEDSEPEILRPATGKKRQSLDVASTSSLVRTFSGSRQWCRVQSDMFTKHTCTCLLRMKQQHMIPLLCYSPCVFDGRSHARQSSIRCTRFA